MLGLLMGFAIKLYLQLRLTRMVQTTLKYVAGQGLCLLVKIAEMLVQGHTQNLYQGHHVLGLTVFLAQTVGGSSWIFFKTRLPQHALIAWAVLIVTLST